ncbi:MAG: hydroxyacid dehydrogenase, partial [Oscillospiraceae bacterium]|nr:hydroxyacid dehydrogenase [Oscillospiraceae bacterium]
MAKVVVTEQIDPVGVALLKAAGHEVVELDMKGGLSVDPARVGDADALLVRIVEVEKPLIESCPNLKLISKHGVGVDNIDVDAARAKGVAVTIAPGANSDSVAEHAFAMLMALAKNLPTVCAKYRAIGFGAKNCAPGIEITGKTLGIIGCGRIGSRIAKMAHGGFDMKVLAYDPYITEAPEGVELVSDRDRVFAESDFVTLHPVLNKETEGSVGAREFALMKPGCIFINCGRGPLIDEQALIDALQSGHLGGAGLDVTAQEPCPPESPLFAMPNVLLTPHYAPTTHEAAAAVSRVAAQNVIDFFEHKPIEGL